MAIETVFADGFDSYSNKDDMDDYLRWNYVSSDIILTTSGRRGGGCLRCTGGNQSYKQFGTVYSLAVMGAAVKFIGSFGAGGRVIFVKNAGDTDTYGRGIYVNSSGYLGFFTTNTYKTVGTIQLQLNTWYYIELRVYLHSSSGEYEIKINGVSDASETGINTQVSGLSGWSHLSTMDYTGEVYIDDLYLRADTANTAGGFFGDVKVESIIPNANGTNRDFTLSTGTDDYAVLDEMPPSFTDYAYSSTTGHKISVGFEDLTGSDDVKSAVVYSLLRTNPSGYRQLKTLCRSNSVNYLGAAQDTPDSAFIITAYDTDPDTASAWTVSGLNAAEFGIEVQAAS